MTATTSLRQQCSDTEQQGEPRNSVRSSADEHSVRHDSRTLRSEYKQGSPSSMELRVRGLGICYISFYIADNSVFVEFVED